MECIQIQSEWSHYPEHKAHIWVVTMDLSKYDKWECALWVLPINYTWRDSHIMQLITGHHLWGVERAVSPFWKFSSLSSTLNLMDLLCYPGKLQHACMTHHHWDCWWTHLFSWEFWDGSTNMLGNFDIMCSTVYPPFVQVHYSQKTYVLQAQ